MLTMPRFNAPLLAAFSLLLAATLALGQTPAPLPDVTTVAIPGVVAAGVRVQLVKEGFASTEGPIALPDGSFAFTETSQSRIHRIDAFDKVSVYLENTNGANGLGIDRRARLIAVQTVAGRTQVGPLGRSGPDAPMAANYRGVAFSRPNDLVVGQNQHIYFTDPGTQAAARSDVYHLKPNGELEVIDRTTVRPNGITLSPDEKVLYLANTGGEYVLAFDVANDGSVSNRRNFARLQGVTTTPEGTMNSGADGLAIDAAGRLYVASNPGVQVFSPEGRHLGTIPTPVRPQNIAFAGANKSTLYIVGRGNVYKVALEARGFADRSK